ncbi:hypothetical protein Tco_0386203 [Tanacetum coccineum]
MSLGTKLGDHINEFNKLILDLANIDIEIEEEDQALMLLTSLPSSYENFVETLLYRWESLIMKDVIATLNSRELKKIIVCTKEETCDGLYGHLKRDCPMKSSGSHDQDSNSSDDEGNAYFREALVVVENEEITELVMDSGTLKKEGYTVKMQMGKIKVIKGCRFIMTGIMNKNCVYTLDAKVMSLCTKSLRFKTSGLKQLGSKQVGFRQLGLKQVRIKQLGPSIETGVHGVQVDKRVWFEVKLQGREL